jgi:hypothetical protein
MSPARFDIARYLAVAGDVDTAELGAVPERYRRALRDYLGRGVLPEGALRAVLEGELALGVHRTAPADVPELIELHRWIETYLPASCHGCRDQVQLWIVYVRRARGRAMLAAMDGAA